MLMIILRQIQGSTICPDLILNPSLPVLIAMTMMIDESSKENNKAPLVRLTVICGDLNKGDY